MQHVALEHGLILVDTKYEFGKGSDGTVLLIDEVGAFSLSLSLSKVTLSWADLMSMCQFQVHTPDSSRYWIANSYEERFRNGIEPENVDKVCYLFCQVYLLFF